MRAVLAAAMLTCVIVSPAAADPAPRPAGAMVTDDCALARKAGKTCVLDVPAEAVDGRTPVADDVAVRLIRFGTARSLIRLRRDFVPEIVKAADDL